MARGRIIKPEFWDDEKTGMLSAIEKCLFLGMLNHADDEGLIRANPLFLKSKIFPYDEQITSEDIKSILEKLNEAQLIFLYTKNNQHYSWIIKFRIYQRIDRPQKPQNPPPSIQNRKYSDAIYKRDGFICNICGEYTDLMDKPNICNSKAPSIDHHIPKSKGGSDYPSNLKTACLSCNKKKGTQLPHELIDEEIVSDQQTFDDHSTNDQQPLDDHPQKGPEQVKLSKVKLSKEEIKNIPDSDEPDTQEIYRTKKKKKLQGKRLQAFNQFWDTFNYKSGKAEAADAWLEIPELTTSLVNQIIQAAEQEDSSRAEKIDNNKTPIMAQGWITGRRWEDEAFSFKSQSTSQVKQPKKSITELMPEAYDILSTQSEMEFYNFCKTYNFTKEDIEAVKGKIKRDQGGSQDLDKLLSGIGGTA